MMSDISATSSSHAPEPDDNKALQEIESVLPEMNPLSSTTPRFDCGAFAYEILLLQQRLAAYEQLHIEEMAELRKEIERLRRAFLQETNPRMHAISPSQNIRTQE